jgi:hypothetical protein
MVLVNYLQPLILTHALMKQPPVIIKREIFNNILFVHVFQLDRVWVVQRDVGLIPAPVTCNEI